MDRVLYFDAFNGAAGDMILGGLIDLGMPLCHLQEELRKLNLDGYHLSAEKIERQGMFGINFQVIIGAHSDHSHSSLEQSSLSKPSPNHAQGNEHDHSPRPGNSHGHHHHRGFTEIQNLIESSTLDGWVKNVLTDFPPTRPSGSKSPSEYYRRSSFPRSWCSGCDC